MNILSHRTTQVLYQTAVCLSTVVTSIYLLMVCCTRYSDSLPAGQCGDRIPVEATFSAPVQTGYGVHPFSYEVGMECPSLGKTTWAWW